MYPMPYTLKYVKTLSGRWKKKIMADFLRNFALPNETLRGRAVELWLRGFSLVSEWSFLGGRVDVCSD